jgi:hypothetical protein
MLRALLVTVALFVIGSSTALAQATGHRVPVNGMKMYYEVSGAGGSADRPAWRLHEYSGNGRDHP